MTKIASQTIIKLNADISDLKGKMSEVSTSVKKADSSVTKMGDSLGRLVLSGALIAGIKQYGEAILDGYDKQLKAEAKVAQAIKTTGGVALKTQQELINNAAKLQGTSIFGDEEILNDVMAQLLTFTGITGDEFDRAAAMALDLSTVLGSDLKSTTIQLGKALNDPINGLTSLRRVGVAFTASQTDMIKSMVEMNRVAEAQSLMLDILYEQYGGQAAQAAEAGLGKWQQVANLFGDMLESFGKDVVEGGWLNAIADKTKEILTNYNAIRAAGGNTFESDEESVKSFTDELNRLAVILKEIQEDDSRADNVFTKFENLDESLTPAEALLKRIQLLQGALSALGIEIELPESVKEYLKTQEEITKEKQKQVDAENKIMEIQEKRLQQLKELKGLQVDKADYVSDNYFQGETSKVKPDDLKALDQYDKVGAQVWSTSSSLYEDEVAEEYDPNADPEVLAAKARQQAYADWQQQVQTMTSVVNMLGNAFSVLNDEEASASEKMGATFSVISGLISQYIALAIAKGTASAQTLTPPLNILATMATIASIVGTVMPLIGSIGNFAEGGVSDGGVYTVGENGRENVFLPQGSRVLSRGDSMRSLAGNGDSEGGHVDFFIGTDGLYGTLAKGSKKRNLLS